MAKKQNVSGVRQGTEDLTPAEVEVVFSSTRPGESLRVHRAVVTKARALARKNPVVLVNDVANAVDKDPRTVHRNLEILCRYHHGYFLDADEKVFAFKDRLEEYVDEQRAAAERDALLRAGRGQVGRLLDRAEARARAAQ